MAGCKVRSGKPGRFEHKKGGERGGIRRRAGVNREQTGTWDAKRAIYRPPAIRRMRGTEKGRAVGDGKRKALKETPFIGTAAVLRRCGRRDGNGTPYRFWVRRQKEDVRTREGRKRELVEKSGRYRKGIEISQA